MTAKGTGRAMRLLIYDRTCTRSPLGPGLSHAWAAGARLYQTLGRIDAARGVASWAEALDFLVNEGAPAPIGEIQFWGHGHWGVAYIAGEPFDVAALAPRAPLDGRLDDLRARLLPDDASLIWFRTCETFGNTAGQQFARALTGRLRARAAGHTHTIGFVQSGLHVLAPGESPTWSPSEGVVTLPGQRQRPAWSRVWSPSTITALHGKLPRRYRRNGEG